MHRSTFTSRVRRAKQDSGKTLDQLAEETGLRSKTTLHERIHSRTLSGLLDWFKRFARALGVSPSWLAFGDEDDAS